MSNFEMLLADFRTKLETKTEPDYVTWVEAGGATVYVNLLHVRLALFYPDRCEVWLGDNLVHETRDPAVMEMLRECFAEVVISPRENSKRKGAAAAS